MLERILPQLHGESALTFPKFEVLRSRMIQLRRITKRVAELLTESGHIVMAESAIKYVRITIRLGSKQTVNIQADRRVTYRSNQSIQFERDGEADVDDTNALVTEVLDKLKAAFGVETEIALCADGETIVACQNNPE